MLPKNLRNNPGRIRAIIYAVLVHVGVIVIIVIGFRWTQSPTTDESVVQAVAVPELPERKPEEPDKRALEEAARKKAEEEKRREAELKKKQEEEQEVKRRQEAERKKQEAEDKEKQKRLAAEERKKEEQRRQNLAEQSLREQLEAEEKQRQSALQSRQTTSEVNKYIALIKQRVSQNWNRPIGAAKGLKCVVNVHLTPNGEVLSAVVARSSGNTLFDRSVENAVYKAAPLPLPEDPALFDNFRKIEFLFSPEE